jgi:hypothetical protein
LVEGPDFFWVVLQLAHGCADLGFKIGVVGNCHAANGVGLEVFPDQFVWIAVGRIGRKKKQPQSAVLAVDKSSGLLGNVGGAAIDDQEKRATLAFWVGYAAAELKPLYLRLRELILGSLKIAVDAKCLSSYGLTRSNCGGRSSKEGVLMVAPILSDRSSDDPVGSAASSHGRRNGIA